MSVRLVLITGLLVATLSAVLGAPKAIHSEKDLRRNLVEFLKQDANFLTELEKTAALGEGSNLLRQRRQAQEIDEAESQTVDLDSGDIEIQQKDAGFFDRAAKFVMDLLQRFLKWINTDSN